MVVSSMHDIDVFQGKGVGLYAIYVIATLTEPERDEREITDNDFIHKQAKDSYCL